MGPPHPRGAQPVLAQSVADMEREVVRLQRVILETKIYINDCSAVASLPPETLSEIFILACRPEYDAIGGLDKQDVCPLQLGAVCKAWRNLAWSTRQLWSNIFLLRQRAHVINDDIDDLLIDWLSRSANYPLSIRFDAPNLNSTTSVIDTLVGVAARWKNVAMFLPQREFSYFELANQFPILEHLSVRAPDYRFKKWGVDDIGIFNFAMMPRLTCLHLPKTLRALRLDTFALRSLTTFSVTCINNNEAYFILSTMPNLQKFLAYRLEFHNYIDNEQLNRPILQRLVMNDANYFAAHILLSRIFAPGLEDFTLETRNEMGQPTDGLSNFLNESRKLRRLKISCALASRLIGWILKMGSLPELHYKANVDDQKALAVGLGPAVPGKSTGDHLPLLEHLTLEGPLESAFPFKRVSKMLAYRSSGLSSAVVRLKSVSISSSLPTDKDMNRFQKVANGGLQVKFICPDGKTVGFNQEPL